MAISDEISRLQTAKSAIKGAIEEKGVSVPENITLSTYDQYILQIKTQGLYEIKEVTPNAAGQIVTPSEGYDALSQVIVNGDLNLVSSNIKDGVTIFGITGSLSVTPNLQEKSATPSTSSQTITPDDGYDGLSSVTVNGDYNLVSDNIKKGVSIFGVTGNFAGGGGGSSDYNVFVQTSEPKKKDGIWIKDNVNTNGLYFSQNMTSKGQIVDSTNFNFLNSTSNIKCQIVVGDYLYSIGTNTSSSYIYNLRTKSSIGNMNLPSEISINTAYAFEHNGNIYVVCNISTKFVWFKYNIGQNSSSSAIQFWTNFNSNDPYYFFASKYQNSIYIYASAYYNQNLSTRLDLETETFNETTSLSGLSQTSQSHTQYCVGVGEYIYIYENKNRYFRRHKIGTAINEALTQPTTSDGAIYGSGNYIYLFLAGTNLKTYYKYDIENSTWKTLTTDIGYSLNLVNNSSYTNMNAGNCQPLVFDSDIGLLYLRSQSRETTAFQYEHSPLSSALSTGTIVLTQSFGSKPVLMQDNTNLAVSISDISIVDSLGALDNQYLSFWGDGEKWNLFKNPTGATATVTFDTGGGSAVSSQEILIGSKITKPDDPTKDNYLFGDWYLDGKIFDFSTPITGDITLTASWLTYEVIDYIESSGTQYIDTLIKPSDTFKIEMQISRTDLSDNSGVCGSYTGSQWGMYLYLGSNGKYGCAYGTQNVFVVNNTNYYDTIKHNIILDLKSTGLETTVDGSLISTNAFSSIANGMNFYLFKCNDGGTTRVAKIKMYSFKIYDNGTLVRNFIPIKRSDGVYALLDQVNNKAYYNAGTGSFTGRNDYFQSDYTQLSYIESSGTQYIDTGFKHNQNTRYVIDYDLLSHINWRNIFGSNGGAKGTNKLMFVGLNDSDGYYAMFGSNSNNYAMTTTGRHKIDFNKNVLKIDSTSYTFSSQTFSSEFNCLIFGATGYNGNPAGLSSMKLYSFKIYDNDILVRDFIPCKRNEDNVIGLYDRAFDKFYINAGTGEFLGE